MRRSTGYYLFIATFLAGSFAGAAFGVFFTLSIQPPAVSDQPSATTGQKTVSSDDAEVISVVKKVSPSVVSISVLKDVSTLYNRTGPIFPFEDFFGFQFPGLPQPEPPAPKTPGITDKKQAVGGGTGFVVSGDGLIVTNKHVVLDEDADYEVKMQDGRTFAAKVLARDPVLDLALIKIEASGVPVVTLGDSDALEAGETVIAIGNVLSEYQNTVTKGVVSGINRRVVAGGSVGFSEVIEEAIQTDAAINPGNSGGPLIDLGGRVIGVNTAVNQAGQSIGFAIPINAAKSVIESVKATGKIVRPWLGVRYVLLGADIAKASGLTVEAGALIQRGPRPADLAVVPGSPADKAGIVENDILLEVDGLKIGEAHSLASLIARKRPGSVVRIVLLHQGERRTVQVTLGELPDNLN